jgi:predicted site-specific integrase-resolvase
MLLTYDEYCQKHGTTKRNLYYLIKDGKINPVAIDGKNYCYAEEDVTGMNAEEKKMVVRDFQYNGRSA